MSATHHTPTHGETNTCKTCGEKIKYSQYTGFWSHTALEPGYFGPDGFFVICGRPEPAAPPSSAQQPLETVITQVLHFSDGSRLRVEVQAPAGVSGDMATATYHRYFGLRQGDR